MAPNSDIQGVEEGLFSAAKALHLSPTTQNVGSATAWSNQHLCSTCRSIDFEAILFTILSRRNPTSNSSDSASADSDESSVENKDVDFGFLDELILRSSTCQFCGLVLEAATRINGGAVLPGTIVGQRLKCIIRSSSLGILYHAKHRGQDDCKVEVNRLVVDIQPSPYEEDPFNKIKFQPYLDPHLIRIYEPKGLGRVTGDQVDIKLLRDWLHQCEDHHGEACSNPSWLGNIEYPSSLRVVDVKRRCVVSAPPRCRYLALSYVWGARQTLRSTTANIEQFQKQSEFDKEIIPATIANAMGLVSALGERYLWVDALCIIQDDSNDQAEQIMQMDVIYARAVLTIIAAAGNDATAGLPGLAEGTRNLKQGTVQVSENLSLMQTLLQGDDRHFDHSTWISRGWTFQERLLSSRALLFTQDQIYWQCESATWIEETLLEPVTPEFRTLPVNFGCGDEWDERIDGELKFTMYDLGTYITQYSERQFTNESDALAGFFGILQRIAQQENEVFHWGLPHSQFDRMLSWKNGDARRQDLCKIQNVPFPSWSWLGWTGFISTDTYHHSLGELTLQGEIGSEIVFYKLGIDGTVQEIKAAAPVSYTTQARQPFSSSSIRKNSSRALRSQWKSFGDVRSQWKGNSTVVNPVFTLANKNDAPVDGSLCLPHLEIPINREMHDSLIISQPFLDTGRLVFWTSYASFLTTSLSDSGSHSDSESEEDEGETCVLSVKIGGKDILLKYANGHFRRAIKTGQLLDFIVISRKFEPYSKGGEFIGALNLMVIKWSEVESGVASRIGVASIKESDWIRADRKWKLVILE